jgi:hypothetical protein
MRQRGAATAMKAGWDGIWETILPPHDENWHCWTTLELHIYVEIVTNTLVIKSARRPLLAETSAWPPFTSSLGPSGPRPSPSKEQGSPGPWKARRGTLSVHSATSIVRPPRPPAESPDLIWVSIGLGRRGQRPTAGETKSERGNLRPLPRFAGRFPSITPGGRNRQET